MARPGPPPKPNSRRINQHSSRQNLVIRVEGEVKIPPADRNWHKRSKAWYQSLRKGAVSTLYEPEHWEIARIIAEMLSDELNLPAEDRKGVRIKNIFDLLKQIYGTPDALQRAHIEIQRVLEPDEPESAQGGVSLSPERIEELAKRAARAL